MRKTLTLIFLVALLFSSTRTHGQNQTDSTDLDPVNKNMVARAATVGGVIYAGGLSYLSFIWYSDKERVPFHYYNDNSGYLQMDKMGHSFAAYGESYIAYKWLRKAGMSKTKALLYGGSMGFIMQAPIEVFDGLYKGWGFSWGDIAANTAGSLLLVGQELIFDEQVLRYKISFSPSEMSKNSHGYLGDNLFENFAYDYNGHTYWLTQLANMHL
ncbi:MAG: YfiM family protein [Prolixibacteraceae bacterium]|nr:YfiM family protein [Prolixibacteraceae bacterium]